MPDAASLRHSSIATAICAFAYLYVFPYQERINNPNENVRFYMTAALVEEGRYEIDTLRERYGWVNDAATHDGHVYSVKAPGTSLLALPAYAAYLWGCRAFGHRFDRIEALWACRMFASVLPSLVFLFFLHRFLCRRGHHPLLLDAAFFSLALGSLFYGYALLLVSHSLSAVTAFSAFMLLFACDADARPASLRRAFFAGFLAAATTLFEYPGLPCSIVLTVYAYFVLRERSGPRALLAYAAGGALPALAMMHFQWRAFGSPFRPGHLMVENPAFREAHHQGFYGAVAPSPSALYGLLFDPGAGLFPLTPFLLLAIPGFYVLLRKRERAERRAAICAISLCVLTVLAISAMNNWRGGWTIGPRYLALAVPFMTWAALYGFESWAAHGAVHVVVIALASMLASFVASGVPSAYYPHLPPELTRPLPQLFAILIAHDYAPHNAAAFAGVYGSVSMLPLALSALCAFGLCVRFLPELRASALALVSGASVGVALCLLVPLFHRPSDEPGVSEAIAFVTRHFSPEGHDAAARLRARLRAERVKREADLRELAELYEAEGRSREATLARSGRL